MFFPLLFSLFPPSIVILIYYNSLHLASSLSSLIKKVSQLITFTYIPFIIFSSLTHSSYLIYYSSFYLFLSLLLLLLSSSYIYESSFTYFCQYYHHLSSFISSILIIFTCSFYPHSSLSLVVINSRANIHLHYSSFYLLCIIIFTSYRLYFLHYYYFYFFVFISTQHRHYYLYLLSLLFVLFTLFPLFFFFSLLSVSSPNIVLTFTCCLHCSPVTMISFSITHITFTYYCHTHPLSSLLLLILSSFFNPLSLSSHSIVITFTCCHYCLGVVVSISISSSLTPSEAPRDGAAASGVMDQIN